MFFYFCCIAYEVSLSKKELLFSNVIASDSKTSGDDFGKIGGVGGTNNEDEGVKGFASKEKPFDKWLYVN